MCASPQVRSFWVTIPGQTTDDRQPKAVDDAGEHVAAETVGAGIDWAMTNNWRLGADRRGIAAALSNLAIVARCRHESEKAEQLAVEALGLALVFRSHSIPREEKR